MPSRKPFGGQFRPTVFVLVGLLTFTFSLSSSQAQLYWDTNGATAGSGNAGGNWNSGTNWSSSAGGTAATVGWADGNQAVFSAGNDGTGTLNINITGTVNPNGVVVEEGNIVTSGNINSTGSLLVQRGMGPTSLTLAGGGNTTATFVGVGNPLNIGGQTGTATLVVQDTHDLQVNGNLFLGERAGHAGNLDQTGGTVGVSGEIRVGHWPNETSAYDMTGGVLDSSGGLYVGWDGVGDMDVSGNAIVNANAGTVIQRNSTLTVGGNADFNSTFIQVGQSRGNGTLEVQGNATVDAMRLDVGNPAGISGSVNQSGGTITLTGGGGLPAMRLGHWPNETSTYNMTGGTLNTNDVLAVGWDGMGLMDVSGSSDVNVNSTIIVQRDSTLTVAGNATLDMNFFSIGDQRGVGHVDQKGGAVTVSGANGVRVGHWPTGAGSTYDITGGQLNTTTLAIGWDGANDSMNVSGTADVNVSGTTIVQHDSTLTIAGNSTLDMNFFSIGDQRGVGHVDQTGGTVTVSGANGVRVGHWPTGAGSTYDITGGQLNTTTLAVGWDGANDSMNVSGTADVNVGGSTLVQHDSTLTVAGNATLDTSYLSIGDQRGAGAVVQDGGGVTVNGSMRVGHYPNTGSYTMNDGTLAVVGASGTEEGAGTLTVGVDGMGSFNQTGGAVTAHRVHLNARFNGLGGTSTYDLTGGSLDVGAGGLTGNISGASNFQFNLGGAGTLDLQGNNIDLPESGTRFAFTGGTLQDVNQFNGPLNQNGGLLRIGQANPTTGDTMTVAGDYALNSPGALEIDIFSATDFDVLTTPGFDADLDGTVRVLLQGGYDPSSQDYFDVVLADTVDLEPNFALDESMAELSGGRMFAYDVVTYDDGAQALRLSIASTPEPTSIALWCILGVAFGIIVGGVAPMRNPITGAVFAPAETTASCPSSRSPCSLLPALFLAASSGIFEDYG